MLLKKNDTTNQDISLFEVAKKISQSLRSYKKTMLLSIVCAGFEVVGECLIPFVVALIIEKLTLGAPFPEILNLGLLLILCAILTLAVGALAGFLGADAGAGLAKNLRRDIFHNVQTFSHENIAKYSPASLVTRLTTDVTNVQRAYEMSIFILVRSPLVFVFALVMAYLMAGATSFAYLIIAPILVLGLFLISRFSLPIFNRVFKRYDKLNLQVNENIRGIRTVKSYVREQLEIDKFVKSTQKLFFDTRKAERIIELVWPITNMCTALVFLFVIYFGSKLIISTQGVALNLGQLSALITYGFMVLFSLLMASFLFINIVWAEESSKRIYEVLSEVPTIKNPEHPLMCVDNGSISFKNVSFKYSQEAKGWALKDISVDIPSGYTVGVIGATGSAKTTFASLIARLYDVTAGEVVVAGHNVKEYDLDVLRKSIGLVEQKNMLFSGTILENLKWGNENATLEEVQEVCKIACADDFITSFPKGYETEISQGGTNVSGGQKQRLCIARALLKKPRILIFDDSTSAVDTKTDSIIQAGLKSWAPQTTKIVIAQRISSVQNADMIIVLERGRIHAMGTHEELLQSSEIYRETYHSQTRLEDDTTQGGIA